VCARTVTAQPAKKVAKKKVAATAGAAASVSASAANAPVSGNAGDGTDAITFAAAAAAAVVPFDVSAFVRKYTTALASVTVDELKKFAKHAKVRAWVGVYVIVCMLLIVSRVLQLSGYSKQTRPVLLERTAPLVGALAGGSSAVRASTVAAVPMTSGMSTATTVDVKSDVSSAAVTVDENM
jgi:hypothetical protein